jgi:outer membrane protein, adhesin transport system
LYLSHLVKRYSLIAFMVVTPMYGITIDRALELSLASHPSIKAKTSEYESAQSDLEGAKWARWPAFSLQTQGSEKIEGYDDRYGATFAVRQPLFTGGKISSDIDFADAKVQGTQHSIAESRIDVESKVIDTYAQCVKIFQKINISRKNVTEHERLHTSILNRFEGGISSEADVALAKGRLNQARSESLQFEIAYQNAIASLSFLVGESIDKVEEFDQLLPYKELNEALIVMENNSPTLKRLQQEIKVTASEIESKKSVLYPQVALRYENYIGLTREMNADTSRILVTADFQPGSGLSSVSAIESAQKKMIAAQSSYSAAKLELNLRLSTHFNEARGYLAQIQDAQEYALQTDNVAASYERQYVIGKKSWIDLLNTKRETAQAQYNYIDMKIGAASAIKKLLVLTSEGY